MITARIAERFFPSNSPNIFISEFLSKQAVSAAMMRGYDVELDEIAFTCYKQLTIIDQLLLAPNGKVDLAALPSPPPKMVNGLQSSNTLEEEL
ncbi:MAG TPA: hypothetical protein VFU49_11265 [Ktedonobacteraceae bacterium]|nr:hypothetical protein [Ktedonobacteraceae bacterium]